MVTLPHNRNCGRRCGRVHEVSEKVCWGVGGGELWEEVWGCGGRCREGKMCGGVEKCGEGCGTVYGVSGEVCWCVGRGMREVC